MYSRVNFEDNLSVPFCNTLWKIPYESFWPLPYILHTTCMVNYIMEQVLQMSFLCFLLDYLVWRMHWSWRKSLAYDPLWGPSINYVVSVGGGAPNPLLISTGFLKYSFQTGIKIQLWTNWNFFSVLTEFFFQF